MDNTPAPIPSTSPQPAVQPEVFSPVEPSNRRWLLWLIGVVTLLIVGIAIGIFSAKFLNQSQSQLQLASTPTPTLSPTPTPTPDLNREPAGSAAIADWKTLKDDKNGIEFKYPSNWYYQRSPDWTFDVYLEDRPFEIPQATEFLSSIQIHFNEVQNTVTNQKYFMEKTIGEAQTRIADLFNPQSVKIIENLTIDGKQAIQISGITGPGPLQGDYFEYTVIQLDNKVLFVVLHDKKYEEIYNQILSTFKFISPSG